MARMPPQQPLIAVIGATGTGKSQLAVEIAKRYNGEIINGDAMQLYDGLPIITNKITEAERQNVPHHLLGCIGLSEQTWVVGTFVKKALQTIDQIRSRGKLPILVGGTHYYTQSLLFHDRLADKESDEREYTEDTSQRWPILDSSTDVLLEELKKVDPIMADRWHPNDRRKIRRSLEIWLQTGRKASDVYAEQRRARGLLDDNTVEESDDLAIDTSSRQPMRFPTLIFWVTAQRDALHARLDRRVDKMLDAGLLDEVRLLTTFADSQAENGTPVDETRGIWVSIGFKEFKAYAHALQSGNATEAELEKLKSEAVEKTKVATRRYSKQQLRWIRIKFVNSLMDADARKQLYVLDGSDAVSFDKDVVYPALELTRQWLQAAEMPDPEGICEAAAVLLTPKRAYDLSTAPEKWTKRCCEVCNVTTVTEEQWVQHEKSRAHRKLTSKRRKAQSQCLSSAPIEDVNQTIVNPKTDQNDHG